MLGKLELAFSNDNWMPLKELHEALLKYDEPTPGLAKTVTRMYDIAEQSYNTEAKKVLDEMSLLLFQTCGEHEVYQVSRGVLRMVGVDEVVPVDRRYQDNWYLKVVESIRAHGLLNPIICIRSVPGNARCKLLVWDGSLRVTIMHTFGYLRFPAYVYPHDAKLIRSG